MFYKSLNGYSQRKYLGSDGSQEKAAERLRGEDIADVDPTDLPEEIDGISEEGRPYRSYEYEGVIDEIPPEHRIRLNDSAYAFFGPARERFEEFLEEYEDIFSSLYEIEIGSWSEIRALTAEAGSEAL